MAWWSDDYRAQTHQRISRRGKASQPYDETMSACSLPMERSKMFGKIIWKRLSNPSTHRIKFFSHRKSGICSWRDRETSRVGGRCETLLRRTTDSFSQHSKLRGNRKRCGTQDGGHRTDATTTFCTKSAVQTPNERDNHGGVEGTWVANGAVNGKAEPNEAGATPSGNVRADHRKGVSLKRDRS